LIDEEGMGVYAGLIRYPAEVYGEVKAQGLYYPPDGRDIQQCYLSRSWDELHPALKSFGPPLSLALSGDYGFEGGLDRFGWDEENDSDHYVGFVSPPLVAQIASRLNELSFEQLATKLSEPSRGAHYVEPYFWQLFEFYAATAAGGDCVFIHVA
jgi:hypothetical protein